MDAKPFVHIDADSPEPIYRQVMAQIRRFVAAGHLHAGDEVPSVRELAQDLSVHAMTISKAYSLLEAEGLLARRRGLPMVVAARHREGQPASARVELLRPALEKVAAEVSQLELPADLVLGFFEHILAHHEVRAPSVKR